MTRHCVGVMFICAAKTRPKCDELLNPQAKAMSHDRFVAGGETARQRTRRDVEVFGDSCRDQSRVCKPQLDRVAGARIDGCVARTGHGRAADVVGLETVQPIADAPAEGLVAGQTIKRRFTNIWKNETGTWRLSLRHANVIATQ